MKRAAVFLDRDGTLVHERGPVAAFSIDWLYPYSIPTLLRLQAMGFLLFVVTNQAAVARGLVTADEVDAVHRGLVAALAAGGVLLQGIRYCPHHPDGIVPHYRRPCAGRKPAAGLLRQLAGVFDVDLSRSWMVGDHATDVQAGQAAGTRTCLVDTGHGATWAAWAGGMPSVARASTLADVPRVIAQKKVHHPPGERQDLTIKIENGSTEWTKYA
ncbi:MAG: HAD family hydrolase [Thermaerobacter sp.]|nr:HAD family hydrolase [Thermaerobacter sp.]